MSKGDYITQLLGYNAMAILFHLFLNTHQVNTVTLFKILYLILTS